MTDAAGLFKGSPVADQRRRAVLDAIDLVALADADGWISFLTWAQRAGYDDISSARAGAKQRKRGGTRGGSASTRQWERLKRRLREHGLIVEARAPEDYSGLGRVEGLTLSSTAMRFTVDGRDRLAALVRALDNWLCAVGEVA